MKTSRAKTPVPATPALRHSFSKGCHYENMKGTYEVLSIDGTAMRIRWENGEESETDVELQDRILSRFEREVRATKARPLSREVPDDDELPQRVPQSRGLVAADFTVEVSKTAWRSRSGGIGSLVAEELKVPGLSFGFWVPFRQPMILWADVDQKAKSSAQVQAGFLCRLEEAEASYGFFVRRSDGADGKGTWDRFLEWLRQPGSEERFRSLVEENGMRIVEGSPSPSGFLQVADGRWEWVEDASRTDVQSLDAFLESRTAEPGTLLECVAVMPRDRAVGRGRRIGRDVAQLFESLAPVYRVCLGLPESPPKSEGAPTSRARKRPAG